MPHPSPLTKPSAPSSNVLQRPSGAIKPALCNQANGSGASNTLTPPARTKSASPARKLWQARCTATNDDEQAVSTAIDGPLKPNMYERRPAAALNEFPVAA